ncbi:hypothetical protein F183_A08330 [Bryobacterales bacterium F-183]|nr:hypothetical protein F183_A08330 [Bryobacterales bacterium F-183]
MAVARYAYLLLAVLGLVIPYSKFLPWLFRNGLNLPLFFQELFVNRISSFFGWDVILSAVALLYWIWREKHVPRRWMAATGTLLVGVSFGLPLFLYLRESKQPVSVRVPQWLAVPLGALLFSAWFFAEYTGIARRVHIPFDLELYHYPLAEYAFQALKQGRVPLWDDAQYLGIPFAANLQVALFYPPTWLMYAANLGKDRLPFSALEYFMLAHLYAGFLLCYYWLRNGKGLHILAAIFGAGIFAFSTYAVQQLSHMGLVCGYVWIPLGWWGIDRYAHTRSYRRSLWMITTASALCFLAGYPSIWAVFALAMGGYALGYSLRAAIFASISLGVSLLLSSVALLPAIEAMRFMQPEPKYGAGSGISDWTFYLTFFIPNLFDFDLAQRLDVHPRKDLFYLGAIALFGIACSIRASKAALRPVAVALALSAILFVNAWGYPGHFIEPVSILSRVLSSWYFLAAIIACAAVLAALGLDRFFRNNTVHHVRDGALAALCIAALAWAIRLVYDARYGHSALSSGWASILDGAAALALVTALAFAIRSSTGTRRTLATVALFVAVAAEYKAFGTSRRLGVELGKTRTTHSMHHFPGLSDQALAMLQQARPSRVALDYTGPTASLLRFPALTTPHGFDPFLPQQYADFIRANKGEFYEGRLFHIPPDPEVWRLLGVRYLLTAESGEAFRTLSAKPDQFRHVPPFDDYTHVFEVNNPAPPYGWSQGDGRIENTRWTRERRNFRVVATGPSQFRLSEQFYPGWHATLDGEPVDIQRCHGALQCVAVPPGEHDLRFWYQSEWLVRGAIVTLATVVALSLFTLKFRRNPADI